MNSSYIDDHYYDTSDGFKNYEPNTSDPGPWMTIGVCLYSIMCVLVFLPLSVVVGKMCTKRITRSSNDVSILNKKKTNTNNSSISSLFVVKTKTSGDDDCPSCDGIEIHSGYLMQQSRQHEKKNSKKTLDKTIDLEEQVNSLKVSTVKILDDLISKSRNIMKSQIFCKKLSDQRIVEENETAVHFDSSRQLQDVSLTTINKAEDKSVSEIIIPMAVVEETSMVVSNNYKQMVIIMAINHYEIKALTRKVRQSGSSDEQHSKENSIKPFMPALKTTYNRNNCYALSKTISCDKETVRILKLGGPFTISSLSDSVFDAIILAIVSKYLGVQSLSAMVVTHLLVGLTDTFIKGVADTLETLCSHAIGTDNYTLAGQYAQIAVGMYTIVSLPVAAAWWFLMDDAIRLFGMNDAVVIIGHDYSKVLVGECLVTGIYHALFTLLDVSGYASHASLLLILEGTISVLTVWGLLHGIEDMNLFWVGVTKLCICSLVYLMFAIFVIYKGWLNPFWHGMTKTFAFKNIQAVKNVVGTAMPLALGTLLEYGEWEALTFFAAALGPAEGKLQRDTRYVSPFSSIMILFLILQFSFKWSHGESWNPSGISSKQQQKVLPKPDLCALHCILVEVISQHPNYLAGRRCFSRQFWPVPFHLFCSFYPPTSLVGLQMTPR